MTQKLIIFTRYPKAGQTKTRLIPTLGARKAASLQKEMTERTVATARQTLALTNLELEIRYTGCTREAASEWLGSDLKYVDQGPGDLGERLERAFADAAGADFLQTTVIGSDCPNLNPELLEESFRKLADHDLVIGPAADGGYYLIGLTRPNPELFKDISWGNNRVFAETMARAKALNLSPCLLEELADVDRPADLRHLGDHPDL